jgi:hypothetical protein
MNRGLLRTIVTIFVTVHAVGCQSSTQPFDTVASGVVQSQLSVSPVQVASGSTIKLMVESTNRGPTRISASNGCAPGLGFRIRRPDGVIVDPYAGLAFICPRLDSQDLEPGETDVVTWEWTPTMSGRYEAIGGLIVDGQVVGPSMTQTFQVN